MMRILEGPEWLVCQINDVSVFGATHKEHDDQLLKVMQSLESVGVMLNVEKCEFAKDQLQFLGHLVSKTGIQADPQKYAAITKMKSPSNVPELHSFLGMINQCGKFSSKLTDITQPLQALLAKIVHCIGVKLKQMLLQQ